jgi:hypothetical protein
MDTHHALTAARRDSALRRLRIITIGAAASGMAAVVGFGGLAAATYAGHVATTSVAGAVSGPATAASGAAAGSSGAAAGTSTVTTITAASGRGGHVTTGGS